MTSAVFRLLSWDSSILRLEFCPTFRRSRRFRRMARDLPQDFIQGIGSPSDSFHNIPIGAFWQDSWRASPKVTLNYGVRYDVEIPPSFKPPTALAQTGYNLLGLQKGIQTDKNNIQPRIGVAIDPKGDGKTVIRASYGMFYDHPLLGLYFLGDASDGSTSGQLAFAGGAPCNAASTPYSPGNLNGASIFTGTLSNANCMPVSQLNYEPNRQQFQSLFPAGQSNQSLFLQQQYLTNPPAQFGGAAFPLAFQPFGYPQAKNFVYAYAQQANVTVERDLGGGFALSLAYNFNGGRHLNRPINANTIRGDLLVANWQAAYSDPTSNAAAGPLQVGTGSAPCGVNPNTGLPWVSAALTNFFRPGGNNPSIANFVSAVGGGACLTAILPALMQYFQAAGYSTAGFNANCDPASFTGCIPFGDMDANYSERQFDLSRVHGQPAQAFPGPLRISRVVYVVAFHRRLDRSAVDTDAAGQLLSGPRSIDFAVRPAAALRFQRRLPDWQSGGQRLRQESVQRLDFCAHRGSCLGTAVQHHYQQ